MKLKKPSIALLVLLLTVTTCPAGNPRLAILPTVDITIQGLGPEVDSWLVEELSTAPLTILSPQVTAAALTQLGIIDQMVKLPENASSLGELLRADAIAYCTLAALGDNYGLVISLRDGIEGEMIDKGRFNSTTYVNFEGIYQFIADNVTAIRPEPTEEAPRPDLTALIDSINTLEEGLGGLALGPKQVAVLPPISISGGGRSLDQVYLQLAENSSTLNERYQALSNPLSGIVEIALTISSSGRVQSLSQEPANLHSPLIESWLSSINFGTSTGTCRVDFLIYFGE